MNTLPLTTLWLQIFALIAVEVGIVSLLAAFAQPWCRTAVWRKTLCQAALIAIFVIACSELSGAGRSLMWKFFSRTERGEIAKIENTPLGGTVSESAEIGLNLHPAFRAKVMDQLAINKSASGTVFDSAVVSGAAVPSSMLPTSQLSELKHRSTLTDTKVIVWLATILAGGAALVLGRACLGRLLLVLLGSRRKAVTNVELLQQVASLAQSLRISRRIRIVESPRLVSPIAFGLLRPTIGLPLNFAARFSRGKQEAMLTHELAHLAAYDPLWHFVADLIVALFWWHPGVWWMRRQLQLSSELAADEASLISADGPRVLAECLVEMGAQLARPFPGQLRVAGFRSDLGYRVQRLMRLEGTRWIPISRARSILARSLGPIALAATVMLCTAWAVPRQLTQGESMQIMKKNWQRALATFAAVASMQTPNVATAQDNPPGASAVPSLAPVSSTPPQYQPGAPEPIPGPIRADPNAAFYRRYGIQGPAARGGPRGGKLEAKLREIVLEEVKFDGLPLSEVLHFLGDEARKRDSEKTGINFLINPNPPTYVAPAVGAVDPSTGLPVSAAPVETMDVNTVTVRFNMPLRHVTLADVLDAIVRVADHPIQYTVEDYAVIFSLRPEANVSVPTAGRAPGPAPLVVRTFHVDTNTFVGGLESAFGIKVDTKGKGESQSKKIQTALKDLLAQLNVSMDGNKAIFYNELTATVMVRVAVEDLDVIQAAIETLGGQAMGGGYAMGYPGPSGVRK